MQWRGGRCPRESAKTHTAAEVTKANPLVPGRVTPHRAERRAGARHCCRSGPDGRDFPSFHRRVPAGFSARPQVTAPCDAEDSPRLPGQARRQCGRVTMPLIREGEQQYPPCHPHLSACAAVDLPLAGLADCGPVCSPPRRGGPSHRMYYRGGRTGHRCRGHPLWTGDWSSPSLGPLLHRR